MINLITECSHLTFKVLIKKQILTSMIKDFYLRILERGIIEIVKDFS